MATGAWQCPACREHHEAALRIIARSRKSNLAARKRRLDALPEVPTMTVSEKRFGLASQYTFSCPVCVHEVLLETSKSYRPFTFDHLSGPPASKDSAKGEPPKAAAAAAAASGPAANEEGGGGDANGEEDDDMDDDCVGVADANAVDGADEAAGANPAAANPAAPTPTPTTKHRCGDARTLSTRGIAGSQTPTATPSRAGARGATATPTGTARRAVYDAAAGWRQKSTCARRTGCARARRVAAPRRTVRAPR